MVKKIKKRIPRKDNQEVEQAGVEGEALDGGAVEPGFDAASPAVEAGGLADGELADEGLDEAPADGTRIDLSDVADDEFGRATAQALQWVIDRRVALGGLAVVVVAGVIGLSMYQSGQHSGQAEVASGLFEAADSFKEAIDDKDTEAEKVNASLEAARASFEKVKGQHAGTTIGRLAELGLASTANLQGKAADAATGFAAVAGASEDMLVKVVALQGQAAALENAGKPAEAQAIWKQIGELNTETFGLESGLQVGRLLEAQSKADEAKAHYEKLKADHSATLDELTNRATKAELERRLGRLGAGA